MQPINAQTAWEQFSYRFADPKDTCSPRTDKNSRLFVVLRAEIEEKDLESFTIQLVFEKIKHAVVKRPAAACFATAKDYTGA